MPEQKLDLFELSTGEMTEPGARAPEVVWRQPFDASGLRGLFHHFPDHFRRHAAGPKSGKPY